ncbi:MAG: glycosyltransferase [Geminicoccaceae bacterium]
MWLIVYLLALAPLALRAPDVLGQPGAREFVILLGLVGAWRYGWGAVHLGRALYYRGVVFPRWRRAADRMGEAGAASQVYILIATYRIRAETTARVYQAAIAEAIRYGRPATIVAGVVELGDQRLIKRIFQRLSPPAEVRLAFMRRPGIGKRHQMACSLRAVSRMRPPSDAAVVLVDGDTLLTPGSLARSLPFLKLMPDVDAITTDAACIVAGGPIMQAWHSLRFAQRHQMMSSMGLSRRLLVITGRMAIYRAEVATDPGFIDALENDHLDHWRLGRFPLLTGEDRSTWYWLLRRGRRMLYLPDVSVVTIEHPLAQRLLPATTKLMLRWSGNMLRGSARAIALGPRRIGLFFWWCLIDQRLSMWTPLLGPVVALLFALCKSALFLYAYLLWVAMTRLVQALLLLTARPTISGLYPPLIYFGQVYGALVKTYLLFRLDRQRWTRQDIALAAELSPSQARLRTLGSAYLHLLAIATLITAVALSTRLLSLPPLL